MKEHRLKKSIQRAFLFIAASVFCAFPLIASPLPFTNVEVRGQMPVQEIFRVQQNLAALNFNLAESRNSIVQVGSYTLVSNNAVSQFRMAIRPGEFGDQDQFAFVLDQNEPLLPSQLSVIPFTVRVSSGISGAVSVSGRQAMEKDLGVRGVYGNNQAILYESGEILAEIPDFDPDLYATGWYSAAIQLSIEVL
ncbi:MAG: hypothetical protein M0R06_18790 [Sphaerochaeta sp.]|jgi:hypothetical protein|uniref:hypothetical protein n=1 Tax=Sphaerochaeta sp. TaxID=1972642 RepID=UPI002A3691B3|nr:hypothetical protein [Sphaerochaeta sp.]MCK9601096.1 hypothetical protein [Sphaerochaeta sp.]MDX9823795.1 hypothetical protein [Sphaerochaeta sp.]